MQTTTELIPFGLTCHEEERDVIRELTEEESDQIRGADWWDTTKGGTCATVRTICDSNGCRVVVESGDPDS